MRGVQGTSCSVGVVGAIPVAGLVWVDIWDRIGRSRKSVILM
jgi:hypothetical protein